MNNEQRGDVAQNEFIRWCGLVSPQMVPILAQPDRFGWDYHVTLRLKEAPAAPRETSPTEPQCKVQVKSATPDAWSVRITLSNWERMVKEPIPWFVAIFRFPNDAPESPEAFLVPIGRDHVAAIIARLRRNDLAEEGEREARDKILTTSFSEEDRVRTPAAMRARIEVHLGSSAADYARTKQQWNATVGYGERPFRLVFCTRRAEHQAVEEAWAAWSLGHRTALRVESVRAGRIRFDLAGPHEEFPPIAPGTLVLSRSPSGQIVVTVSDPEGSRLASVKCAVFSTGPVAHFISKDLHKLRLAAPYVEFLFRDVEGAHPTFENNVQLPGGEAYVSLEDAHRAARVALVLAEVSATGFVMRLDEGGKTQTVHVPPGGTPPDDDVIRRARLFDLAGTIAQDAGLELARLRISPLEMERCEAAILMLGATFDVSLAQSVRVGRDEATSLPGARTIWPFPCVVNYETHVVASIVTAEGTLSLLPPADAPVRYAIDAPILKRHRSFVLRRDEWDPTAFGARVQAVILKSIGEDAAPQ